MKAFIVEDSRLARNELKILLEPYHNIKLVGETGTVDEAYEFLNNNEVDLLFLDINMPGKNGFDLLEMLDNIPYVIFTTAYDEYALKSFEYNTLDYLLKPINSKRFARAVDKALTAYKKDEEAKNKKTDFVPDKIFVKDGEKCWIVKLSDVRYFENEGNYTRLFFDNNKPLVYKSLNQLEERLDTSFFFRANRQQIINLNYIKKVEPWFNGILKITLTCGTEIQVSRRNAVRLKNKLTL
jgi:two-component system LytT family response regulator